MVPDLIEMAEMTFPAQADGLPLYPTAGQQRVLAALQQDVAAGRHLLCLIGPHGSGKTRLLRALAEQLRLGPAQFGWVGLIEQPRAGQMLGDLANALLHSPEVGDESILRRQLVLRLSLADQRHQGIIQLVDQADALTTEDLNLLLHFFPPGHATLILAGRLPPESWLGACSARANGAQIDQCYALEPCTAQDTAGYIRHRLHAAGLPTDMWPDATLATIHQRSAGQPGQINALCAEALPTALAQRPAAQSRLKPEPVPEPVQDPAPAPRHPPASTTPGRIEPDPPLASLLVPRQTTRLSEPSLAEPSLAEPSLAEPSPAEPSPGSVRRLRRSLLRWRAAAILATLALALVLGTTVLTNTVSVSRIALNDPLTEADPAQSLTEPPPSMPTTPTLPPSTHVDTQASSPAPADTTDRDRAVDFAALDRQTAPNTEAESPIDFQLEQPPEAQAEPRIGAQAPAQPDPSTDLDEAATALPTAASSAPTATAAAADPPRADVSAPPAATQRDNRSTKTSQPMTPTPPPPAQTAAASTAPQPNRQRRELARLYLERADYERRNGEWDAALLSVQRGLASDPGNPRLLELRSALQNRTQSP